MARMIQINDLVLLIMSLNYNVHFGLFGHFHPLSGKS